MCCQDLTSQVLVNMDITGWETTGLLKSTWLYLLMECTITNCLHCHSVEAISVDLMEMQCLHFALDGIS
jgi:hypothetical protein